MAAEDALPEVRRHAGHADLHHHLGPVGTRSAGDAARRVAVRGDDRVQRAGDGLQLGHQALIAARGDFDGFVQRGLALGAGNVGDKNGHAKVSVAVLDGWKGAPLAQRAG